MTRCAIATCNNDNRKQSQLSYFRFPRSQPAVLATWIYKCSRQDKFNSLGARICSEHFQDSDYDPAYFVKASLMPGIKPWLREGAVPTQKLHISKSSKLGTSSGRGARQDRRNSKAVARDALHPGQKDAPADPSRASSSREAAIGADCADSAAFADAPSDTAEELIPLVEIQRLSRENRRLRLQLARRGRQWRSEKQLLLRRLRAAERKATKLDKLLRLGLLTEKQVASASSGRRVKWTAEDVSRALGLRCRSRKAYDYVQNILHLPLPSKTTLARWTRGFRVTPGMMEAAVAVLEAAVRGMSNLQRLCVISFDEMALDGRFCYDAAADQVLSGSKLQLLMVRGLCDGWKQPLFYELDSAMAKGTLDEVINLLESFGLQVVAAVSDMGAPNEAMWRQAGVNDNQTWITNPADSTRRVWVFADTPHLLKLMRSHTVAEDGGLLVPNGRGGKALLSRQTFRELLALDAGELRVAHKLTTLHIEGTGQISQRVRLATQLFSRTVSTAIRELLPRRQAQAEAVLTANAWFDVLNSRSRFDSTVERCAYGSTAEVKAAQDRALRKMEIMISESRKATAKHPDGQRGMLPFQHGMLRNTASLRGLYEELRRTTPELRYILTARLNQDCVENCFSQLRGLGGANTTPDAVEVRSRIRVMLMAPSPVVATSSNGRAVLQEPDTEFVTTGRRLDPPDNLSNQALEGLIIEFENAADVQTAEEAEQVGRSFASVTAPPAVVSSVQVEVASGGRAESRGLRATLDREALAFVAGYVAAKCRDLNSGLGKPTSEAPPSSVPSSWIRAVSQGGLTVPSPAWMTVVEDFEASFSRVMGDSVDRQPGIVRRLLEDLLTKQPDLDRRIARKLVTTRLHLRIRWLNQARRAASAARRVAKQIRQHVRSGK